MKPLSQVSCNLKRTQNPRITPTFTRLSLCNLLPFALLWASGTNFFLLQIGFAKCITDWLFWESQLLAEGTLPRIDWARRTASLVSLFLETHQIILLRLTSKIGVITKWGFIRVRGLGFKNCFFKVLGGRKPVCSIWLFLVLNLREVFANGYPCSK